MDPEIEPSRKRATFLSGILGFLFVCVLLGWTVMICGGAAIYFVAVIGGLTLIGFVHYILWGRFLNKAVAGERKRRKFAAGWKKTAAKTIPSDTKNGSSVNSFATLLLR